jgi:hypothetical protein
MVPPFEPDGSCRGRREQGRGVTCPPEIWGPQHGMTTLCLGDEQAGWRRRRWVGRVKEEGRWW